MAVLNLAPTGDDNSSFTLDERLLAQRRADSLRRTNTLHLPVLRLIGFALVCAIVLLVDSRLDGAAPQPGTLLLLALNAGYALLAWFALRHGWGRTGRVDLGFVFLHLDVVVWLVNLHHLERFDLFFAYFLLVRVADQVGFGFKRALYFSQLLPLAYLVHSALVAIAAPEQARWLDRIGIAAVMLLLGCYLAATGLVIERVRRRTAQAMRAARELVGTLEQKTRALEVQAIELEHARRAAEQASVAKSQFLATISHEIRTPMNGVLGTTELLLATPLEPRQQRYATTAHRSAAALLGLIDDLLDLSRIETGQLSIEEAVFDPAAVVTEAGELMAAAAREKRVALRCLLPPALPQRLEGDPRRLRQVLVNLLGNAIKFTERGRIELAVGVLEESARAVRLRFEVRDTGPGIPDDQIDSVFDAFVQGDGSSTRKHGGLGMGLALVKELADAMGGRVGVESEVGEGSLFWFELPLMKSADAPVPAVAAPSRPATGAAMQAHRRRAPRVLLVEDDPVNQLVVQEMLAALGCEVDLATDGAAAHTAAAATRYDLVLMDLHMPGMDGLEATLRIRARERRSGEGHRVPIVALTADVLERDRERCLEAGMDACMTKPVSMAQLGHAVEHWVTDAHAASS